MQCRWHNLFFSFCYLFSLYFWFLQGWKRHLGMRSKHLELMVLWQVFECWISFRLYLWVYGDSVWGSSHWRLLMREMHFVYSLRNPSSVLSILPSPTDIHNGLWLTKILSMESAFLDKILQRNWVTLIFRIATATWELRVLEAG